MKKIGIVFKKEYLTRVKKKSFIIMTLLVPIMFLIFMSVPVFMSLFKSGTTKIAVLDESGYFNENFENSKTLLFTKVSGNLDDFKKKLKTDYDAILYIPKFDLQYPGGFKLFSEEQIGLTYIGIMNSQIEKKIENIRFINAGIDKDQIDKLKADVDLESILIQETGEKKGNAIVSVGMSQIMGFFQYFMIFFYGSLIMRGVMEEKKNRIIEIVVSSIRPFELMLGKILGIAAVALTQLIIWIIFITLIVFAFSFAIMPWMIQQQAAMESMSPTNTQEIIDTLSNMDSFNLPLIVFSFGFFFIFGYLFYSALFAAVGALSDDEAQNQTFTLPLSLPIIISMFIMINVSDQPHSPLAFWSSLIPFCSPIIMIARVPFGVPVWQLVLSMLLLAGGFLANTWLAGKVYRMAILLYGKKFNWNDIRKWIFTK